MLEFNMDMNIDSKSVNLTLNTLQQKLPFNAVYCGEFHTGDKYFTRRDSMDNYLLLLTFGGRGEISWHGQSCLLEPGSAVLIDCSTMHEYKTSEGGEWHFYFLHFTAMTMSGYDSVFLKSLTPVMLRNPVKVYSLMETLNTVADDPETVTYFIMSNIISGILTEMVCSYASRGNGKIHSGREDIARLQEYIEKNFTSELGIEDFMSRTNLSRHYLIHTFKKQTGVSPCRYMHMCRISYSRKLLATTDLPVTRIAEMAGYTSAAVYIRHFKALSNTTPNKYRHEIACYRDLTW